MLNLHSSISMRELVLQFVTTSISLRVPTAGCLLFLSPAHWTHPPQQSGRRRYHFLSRWPNTLTMSRYSMSPSPSIQKKALRNKYCPADKPYILISHW